MKKKMNESDMSLAGQQFQLSLLLIVSSHQRYGQRQSTTKLCYLSFHSSLCSSPSISRWETSHPFTFAIFSKCSSISLAFREACLESNIFSSIRSAAAKTARTIVCKEKGEKGRRLDRLFPPLFFRRQRGGGLSLVGKKLSLHVLPCSER